MSRLELSAAGQEQQRRELVSEWRQVQYLKHADAAIVEDLLSHSQLVTLKRGNILARESGESAQALYVLLEGRLQIRSGVRLIGLFDRAGDVVGELAVLQSPPITVDVVCASDVRALAIPAAVLGEPAYATVAALVYPVLSFGLANLLRALTAQVHDRLDRAAPAQATDPQTGLASRERLHEILGALATAKNGLSFCVAIARINTGVDGAGQPDELALLRFADFLRMQIREGDLATRYDATAFALVLPNCDAANGQNVVAGLRTAILRQTNADPANAITASFGIASSVDTRDVASLLRRADEAADRAQMGAGVAYDAG